MANLLQVPPQVPSPELRLERIDGGLSLRYIESKINSNQSPMMLNLNADDRGALTKRFGQEIYHDFAEGPIHNMISYKGRKVVAHGAKLSTLDTVESELKSGLANEKGAFFVLNDILYYLNGTDFVQWDGTDCKDVVGYIPTLAVSTPPTGGGTLVDDVNLIQPAFKQAFMSDGMAKSFQLVFSGLDATEVKAAIDGVSFDQKEGTDFTVDRSTGVVTFSLAPSQGTNMVIIKAYKTHSDLAGRIKGCRQAINYGGTNDTRVFITGNSDFKNYYWYCGLLDATYWPENNFNKLGSDLEAVAGFAIQYDILVILKERSVYSAQYVLEDSGASFPTKIINAHVGCDMPGTIQLVDNRVTFCNTYAGVHLLLSSDIRDERNIKTISGNINGQPYRAGLLDEDLGDLRKATSADYDRKYYLCVGDKAWVWDYDLSPYNGDEDALAWFPYSRINANCWMAEDRQLFIGSKDSGELIKTILYYNDFGEPIDGYWKSKLFHFGYFDYLKNIVQVWFGTRSAVGAEIAVNYYNDNGDLLDSIVIPAGVTNSFSWTNFSWESFTWEVSRYARTIRRKTKIKKVVYFQIEFRNNRLNENLSILDLNIQYNLSRRVK